MLNSITNALHAAALAAYSYFAMDAYLTGKQFYTLAVLLVFVLTLTAKIFGVIVHFPQVEKHEGRHNFFWIIISVNVVAMNAATLFAVHASVPVVVLGMAVTLVLCALYVRSLYTNGGNFAYIAIAVAFVLMLCAMITSGAVRFAWLGLLVGNLLWVALARVPFLLKHKLHNDIYHFALIVGTFYLYTTVDTGLW